MKPSRPDPRLEVQRGAIPRASDIELRRIALPPGVAGDPRLCILHSPFFILHSIRGLLLAALVLAITVDPPAIAQSARGDGTLAFSVSGQFIVTGSAGKSPLLELPAVTTNANFVHLEPAVLSVSAERIKKSLYRLLGIPSVRTWQGPVYLVLRPALWTDENVTVVSRPIDQAWSYYVQLPNVVLADRYLRGLTGALLLEYANRQAAADGHSAEIPDWLIDGLARQMQQDELAGVLLSAPDPSVNDLHPARSPARELDLDPLAKARQVLRRHQALTIDQLDWPGAAQLTGMDDGVYQASAQLFVAELLKLPDGPALLRQMLARLPQCQNWQTAFQKTYQQQFARPLDLEKWWALTVVGFLSHDPGPSWTPGFSAGLLNHLLTVPVEVRASSNSLPGHAEIPLQAVVRQFKPERQVAIFEAHLHDLRLAQLRMAPQFIALTDAYCHTLAAYLGERLDPAPRSTAAHRAPAASVRLNTRQFVKTLDVLDARRRTLEAAAQPGLVGNF